jgi:hypothetical protein
MTRAALVNNIECGWSFLTYITEREREREREREYVVLPGMQLEKMIERKKR